MVDPIVPESRHVWRWHRHPAFREVDLSLGERAADRMRNGMGSWLFVGLFVAFMAAWAIANSVLSLGGSHGKHGWDPYPYILLNLMLSTLAGLQGAILLIAAKRADQIAARLAEHDFETNVKTSAKVDAILAHLNVPVPADTLTVEPDTRGEPRP